jgi:hypothetical protein
LKQHKPAANISVEQLTPIVEKAIAKFGDQLFIRHAPIVQQEGSFSLRLDHFWVLLMRISNYATALNGVWIRLSTSAYAALYYYKVQHTDAWHFEPTQSTIPTRTMAWYDSWDESV